MKVLGQRLGGFIMVVALMLSLCFLTFSTMPAHAEKVEIRFLTEETDPASVQWLTDKKNEFEKLHPDVTISLEFLGHEVLERIFLLGAAAGDPAEISTTGPEAGKYIREGLLEPVTDVIDQLGRDEISPGVLYEREGEVYVVPYAGGMYMLWARTDLAKEKGLLIPRTWNEFLDFAEKLTVDLDGDGVIDRYGTVVPLGPSNCLDDWFYGRLLSNDVHVLKENKEVVIDKPPYRERALETLRFLKQLSKYSPPGATGYTWTDLTHAYYSETAASVWYAARLLNNIIADAPHLEFVTDTFVYPYKRRPATFNGWDGWIVGKGSDRPDISKKFILSLLSGPAYIDFLHTVPLHLIPIRAAQVYSEEWLNNPLMKSHPDTVAVTQSQVRYSYGIQAPYLGGDYVTDFDEEDVLTDMLQEIILKGVSPEVALDKAAEKMRAIIAGAGG